MWRISRQQVEQSPKSWMVVSAGSYWQWRQISLQKSVYSKENKLLPLLWWKWSNAIKSSPGGWLIHLGNIIILVAQCHFLLLTCGILNNSCSHSIQSEWEPLMLSPCITTMPASVANRFISPFSKGWNSWAEIPWHPHIGPSCPHDHWELVCCGCHLVDICTRQKYPHILCPFHEVCSKPLSHQFSSFFLSPWPLSQIISHFSKITVNLVFLHLFFRES